MTRQSKKTPTTRRNRSGSKGPTSGKGIVHVGDTIEVVGITGGPLISLQALSSVRLKKGDLLRVQSGKKGEYQLERLRRWSFDKGFLRPLDDMIEDEW